MQKTVDKRWRCWKRLNEFSNPTVFSCGPEIFKRSRHTALMIPPCRTISHTVIMTIFLKTETAGPYGSRINRKLNGAGVQLEPGHRHMNPLTILDWIYYIESTYRLRLLLGLRWLISCGVSIHSSDASQMMPAEHRFHYWRRTY